MAAGPEDPDIGRFRYAVVEEIQETKWSDTSKSKTLWLTARFTVRCFDRIVGRGKDEKLNSPGATIGEALAWARRRSQRVVVNLLDRGQYSAGDVPVAECEQWPEGGIELVPRPRPLLDTPPGPLGTGASPLDVQERNATIAASVAAAAFVAVCVTLGWDDPPGDFWAIAVLDLAAALVLLLFVGSVWLGASVDTPTGFSAGRATFLSPRKDGRGVARRIEYFLGQRVPWQMREPLFRLPVLVPIVCAAATFASVPHDPGSTELRGQLVGTLTGVLAGIVVVNGFLAARGQRTIDFVGAVAAVLILTAGLVLSLIEVASTAGGNIHWVAAALAFGLVSIFVSGIRGANPPGG